MDPRKVAELICHSAIDCCKVAPSPLPLALPLSARA